MPKDSMYGNVLSREEQDPETIALQQRIGELYEEYERKRKAESIRSEHFPTKTADQGYAYAGIALGLHFMAHHCFWQSHYHMRIEAQKTIGDFMVRMLSWGKDKPVEAAIYFEAAKRLAQVLIEDQAAIEQAYEERATKGA